MSVAILVPLMLVGIAVLLMAGTHVLSRQREKRQVAAAAAAPAPRILIHSINDDRCTGCDACVAVCPTDVLELVSHKSRVLRFGDCIQCEQCMFACPTQALVMHFDDQEPPPLKVPHLDPFYQTGVQGMYLIGEVAGKPLVKNAGNVGRAVVEHMLKEGLRAGTAGDARRAEGSDSRNVSIVDVAIVGSGPGGLSAALTCVHHGLSYAVLEKEQVISSTVARYPKGKDVMAEPYDVKNVSFLPIYDATKEQMISEWHKMVKAVGLDIKMGEAVESVTPEEDGTFTVRTTVAAYRAQRVVLATGTRGKPRTLGVQGENLPKVASLLDDPDLYKGKDVLVVGGGDSAVEAACALAEAGARVALSYRGKQFNRAQGKNKDKVMRYGKERKVNVLLGSQIELLTEGGVKLALADGSKTELPNHHAFVLIGADPPVAWLEKMGVQFIERPHWYALGATDQLVESLIGRATESPRDVAQLVAAVKRQARPVSLAEFKPPVPEPSVVRPLPVRPSERPRTLPGALAFDWNEDPVFTSAQKPPAEPELGMSLGEFARQSKEKRSQGAGRKKVRTQEETRILRALRDEGARLAHDETGVSVMSLNSGDVQGTGMSRIDAVSADEVSGLEIVPQLVRPQPGRASLPDVSFSQDESTKFIEDASLARRGAFGAPPPAQPAPPRAPARASAPPPVAARAPAPPPPARAPLPPPSRAPLPPPSRGPSPPAPTRSPARPSASPPVGGPPPPQPRFVEARTNVAPPEFLAEMRRVAEDDPRPVSDETGRTDQNDFEFVSRDPDDAGDEAWELDEQTAMADPSMVENLREQLRRK